MFQPRMGYILGAVVVKATIRLHLQIPQTQ